MSLAMWRRYVAEFVGTFMLVFMGCGIRSIVGNTADPAGILAVHITFGLTILAMIYTVGYISGAHFNPALTWGFTLSRHFPWRYVLPYWIAQIAGATCGALFDYMLFSDHAVAVQFGATIPQPGVTNLQAVGIEAVLTFLLMFVNMAVATDRRTYRVIVGVAVGFTVLIGGVTGNSISGGSMNPARSLGPAFFAGAPALSTYWIYIVGPFIGATIAALLYEFLRGNRKYAKGVPEELSPSIVDMPEKQQEETDKKVREAEAV